MQISAIIVAAGSGNRMGSDLNKVYLPLGKHRVLTYSLRAFDQVPEVAELICVYKSSEKLLLDECLADANVQKPVKKIIGGATRQESVCKGLSAVSIDSTYFAIHDGARPFIKPEKIVELIDLAQKFGAVIPAIPIKDTVKIMAAGQVVRTLPRQDLVAVQTPQIFQRDLSIYFSATQAVTDDASLLEGHYPVRICEGDPLNFKITNPTDMWFAETIIRKVDEYQW